MQLIFGLEAGSTLDIRVLHIGSLLLQGMVHQTLNLLQLSGFLEELLMGLCVLSTTDRGSLSDRLLSNGHLTDQSDLNVGQVETFEVTSLDLVETLLVDKLAKLRFVVLNLVSILDSLLEFGDEFLVDSQILVHALELIELALRAHAVRDQTQFEVLRLACILQGHELLRLPLLHSVKVIALFE